MAGRFSVEAVFRAIDRISAPVAKMGNKIAKFSRRAKRMFRGLNRQIDRFGRGLKRVGVVGAAALGAIGLAAKTVIGTGAEFEQTLVNAAAKFPEGIKRGTKAFKELQDAAAKAGRETEFTATESAAALDFLAMAGFNAKQSIAALPKIVDLATASNTDLATASDIASDALGAFGLATKDPIQLADNLSRVMDSMAKTSVTANTNMELMMETIKDGGPVATTAGASLESFLAMTGELANAGIKGSKAGTTLKNMFTKLAAPVPKATRLLASMKVKLEKNGKMRQMADILEDIGKATKKMGNKQKLAALSTIFGNRAIAGSAILLTSGSERIREYTKELEAANGAASTMAATMRDTVMGRLKATQSAFEAIQISIFNVRSTAFGGLLDSLTKYLRKISEIIDRNPELAASMIDTVGKAALDLIKVIGLLGLAFFAAKGLMLAWRTAAIVVKGTIWALKAAFWLLEVAIWGMNIAFTLSPIGATIAIVVALGAAIALLIIYWDDLAAAFKVAFDVIWTGIKALLGPIGSLIDGISAIFGFAKGVGGQAQSEIEEDEQLAAQEFIRDPSSGNFMDPISPQERAAAQAEKGTTSELIIKGDTSKAELRTQKGSGIRKDSSGDFEPATG